MILTNTKCMSSDLLRKQQAFENVVTRHYPKWIVDPKFILSASRTVGDIQVGITKDYEEFMWAAGAYIVGDDNEADIDDEIPGSYRTDLRGVPAAIKYAETFLPKEAD